MKKWIIHSSLFFIFLSFFLAMTNVPDIEFTLPVLPQGAPFLQATKSHHRITSDNILNHIQPDQFTAIINADDLAPFADWFLYFPKTTFPGTSLVKPIIQVTRQQPVQPEQPQQQKDKPFLLCGQSKRYFKTALPTSLLKTELAKVTLHNNLISIIIAKS